MISKSKIKLIKSLAHKKYRKKEKLFIVEGDKNVIEVLQSGYKVFDLYATEDFIKENEHIVIRANQPTTVDYLNIKQASFLKNPQGSIAICKLPETTLLPEQLGDNLSLYLDGLQDPGNVGTIIRICDWFGIRQLFCSEDTVDMYNPKVIQASMGSFCRVKVWYADFESVFNIAKNSGVKILGAFLEGNNIYTLPLPQKALMVVGNEGNGIRSKVEAFIEQKLMIPDFTSNVPSAESLNVAVATGIICAEFKRQNVFSPPIQNETKG